MRKTVMKFVVLFSFQLVHLVARVLSAQAYFETPIVINNFDWNQSVYEAIPVIDNHLSQFEPTWGREVENYYFYNDESQEVDHCQEGRLFYYVSLSNKTNQNEIFLGCLSHYNTTRDEIFYGYQLTGWKDGVAPFQSYFTLSSDENFINANQIDETDLFSLSYQSDDVSVLLLHDDEEHTGDGVYQDGLVQYYEYTSDDLPDGESDTGQDIETNEDIKQDSLEEENQGKVIEVSDDFEEVYEENETDHLKIESIEEKPSQNFKQDQDYHFHIDVNVSQDNSQVATQTYQSHEKSEQEPDNEENFSLTDSEALPSEGGFQLQGGQITNCSLNHKASFHFASVISFLISGLILSVLRGSLKG